MSKYSIVLACAVAAQAFCLADDKPVLKDGKELAVQACLQEADRLPAELAKTKDRSEVKALKKKLQAIKKGEIVAPALLDRYEQELPQSYLDELAVGKAGTLRTSTHPGFPRLEATVVQVVSKHTALVSFVEQFYDEHAQFHHDSKVVFLGIPTEGMADGDKLKLDHVAAVIGTHQYPSRTGPRTTRILKVVDKQWLKAEVAKRLPKETMERIAKAIEE